MKNRFQTRCLTRNISHYSDFAGLGALKVGARTKLGYVSSRSVSPVSITPSSCIVKEASPSSSAPSCVQPRCVMRAPRGRAGALVPHSVCNSLEPLS
jgi:hypothetical protein